MKDTRVAAVVVPAGISVSSAEPRLYGGASSLEDKTEVSSQMRKRHVSSVRLAPKSVFQNLGMAHECASTKRPNYGHCPHVRAIARPPQHSVWRF